jgi:hypothetical protein
LAASSRHFPLRCRLFGVQGNGAPVVLFQHPDHGGVAMNTSQDPGQSVEPSVAIWNPNATANWSLLFTPVFGAFLQMLNWEELAEPELAKQSMLWIYVSIAVLMIYPVLAVLLQDDKGAISLLRGFAFVYLIVWYFASAKAQVKYVKSKYGNSYQHKPWGKVLLYAVGISVGYSILPMILSMAVVIVRQVV